MIHLKKPEIQSSSLLALCHVKHNTTIGVSKRLSLTLAKNIERPKTGKIACNLDHLQNDLLPIVMHAAVVYLSFFLIFSLYEAAGYFKSTSR